MARPSDKAAEETALVEGKATEASPLTAWAEDKGAEALPLTRGDEIGKAEGTVTREEIVPGEDDEEDTEEDENRNYFPGKAVELGHNGMILVLCETPSGFAIFSYDGVKLFLPNADKHIWTDFVKDESAKKVVWLEEFQPFEDKGSAINTETGVDEQLAIMIQKCLKPNQKLAVGSKKYKEIIEKNLGIGCLYDDAVMELMWGLKYCMQHFVHVETKVDRPLMCKGMRTVLDKYRFDYKPEMINCEDWDLLKLVTALKWLCYPEEDLFPDPAMIFSEEERIILEQDVFKYKDKFWGRSILVTYDQIVRARLIRNKWLRRLPYFLKEAEDACKAEQDVCKAEQVMSSLDQIIH